MVEMKSIFFLGFILLNCWLGCCIHIRDQGQYKKLGFTGNKPYFQHPIYEAIAISTKSRDFMHLRNGPIILENCASLETIIKVEFDESRYQPILKVLENCELSFFLQLKNNTAPKGYPLDFVFLKATHEKHVVSMAAVLVVDIESRDSGNHVFDVEGTDYIVLNNFYFKLFLFTVFTMSVLMLFTEIREIVLQYRKRRKHILYSQIGEPINFI